MTKALVLLWGSRTQLWPLFGSPWPQGQDMGCPSSQSNYWDGPQQLWFYQLTPQCEWPWLQKDMALALPDPDLGSKKANALSLWPCTIERADLEHTLQLRFYKLPLKVRHHDSKRTLGPSPSRSGFVVHKGDLPPLKWGCIATFVL